MPVQAYTASLGLDRYQYSHLFTFNLIYRSISLMIINDILHFWADFWAAIFFLMMYTFYEVATEVQ